MKKSAFSMITAIIFIILVSVVGVNTLNLSRSTVSFASRNYVKEQADMLYEGARQLAVDSWLQNPKVSKETYYYPNKMAPEFIIEIDYNHVNENTMLEFDKYTTEAVITIQTKGILKEIADIRYVKDFIISN